MTNTNSDPDFYLPSSCSLPTLHRHNQNQRKKRSKMIKIEPLMASSSVTTTNSGNGISSGVSKPKYYGKKPDPSAPKITRPCSECGKKFWSWKALFGHMRCHPERQWRGINPPPNYRKPILPIQELGSKEPEPALTAEDHEVASCLILLANSDDGDDNVVETTQCGFECSSCKKVFGSHQALGGHRASHKNVKGCFANTTRSTEDVVEDCSTDQSVEVKSKMLMVLGHKCSICLRVFSSGQALGGHKRCHWEKGEETTSSSPLMNNQGFNVFAGNEGFSGLDLNLPAPVEDDHSFSSCSSALTSPPSLALDLRLGL